MAHQRMASDLPALSMGLEEAEQRNLQASDQRKVHALDAWVFRGCGETAAQDSRLRRARQKGVQAFVLGGIQIGSFAGLRPLTRVSTERRK